MEKIKVIHDQVGNTLTIWLSDPTKEVSCDETGEDVVLMKDVLGHVIGIEILNYSHQTQKSDSLSVETILRTGT